MTAWGAGMTAGGSGMTVNVATRHRPSDTKCCRRRYFYRDLRIWREGRRNGRAGDGEMGGARTGGMGARGWEQLNVRCEGGGS